MLRSPTHLCPWFIAKWRAVTILNISEPGLLFITCRWCWSFLSIKREREWERREKVKDKAHKSSIRRLSTLLSRSVNVVYRCLALTHTHTHTHMHTHTQTHTHTHTTIAKSVFHIRDSNKLQLRKFYSSSINTNPSSLQYLIPLTHCIGLQTAYLHIDTNLFT